MKMLTGRLFQGTLRATISALLLALSVSTPLLERADFAHPLAIEAEHQSQTCPRAHDHTICIQVGANFPVASALSIKVPPSRVQRLRVTRRPEANDPRILAYGHPTRAPPTV